MWHSTEDSNMSHRVQQARQVLALGTSYLGTGCKGTKHLSWGWWMDSVPNALNICFLGRVTLKPQLLKDGQKT